MNHLDAVRRAETLRKVANRPTARKRDLVELIDEITQTLYEALASAKGITTTQLKQLINE